MAKVETMVWRKRKGPLEKKLDRDLQRAEFERTKGIRFARLNSECGIVTARAAIVTIANGRLYYHGPFKNVSGAKHNNIVPVKRED